MRYLTVFIRLIIFICVLALSFTLYSSIINGDKRDPSVSSQNIAKADYTSRDVIYHASTKQVNKDSQKLLQEKAKQKRAEKIIKARDKLIREKGYKVYKYGDKKIIRAKGIVRPDIEIRPFKNESTKKKEDVSKDYDMNYPEARVSQKERVDENKEPEEVIVEEKVENFVYEEAKENSTKQPDKKIQFGEEEQSRERSRPFLTFKKEFKCDKHELEKETQNNSSNYFITLNNNLQYDLIRDAYIFWVTPVPQK